MLWVNPLLCIIMLEGVGVYLLFNKVLFTLPFDWHSRRAVKILTETAELSILAWSFDPNYVKFLSYPFMRWELTLGELFSTISILLKNILVVLFWADDCSYFFVFIILFSGHHSETEAKSGHLSSVSVFVIVCFYYCVVS